MDFYRGTPVLEKIAIGKICFYKNSEDAPCREEVDDAAAEIARFDAARDAALAELDELVREASERAGAEEAAVFAGHKMLVKDPLYRDFVCKVIREQRVNAEYAVAQAQAHFVQMLLGVDDPYVQERAEDIVDISERFMKLLGGRQAHLADGDGDIPGGGEKDPAGGAEEAYASPDPVILAADELTPSETIQFDPESIAAFVVRQGAANSHTAILARAMNIPAVIGVDVREDWDSRTAVVDGCTGEVILDPDEECLAQMRKKQRDMAESEARRAALRGHETVTRSGRRICLYANIGEASDVDSALANDAEGIGLFRSEFIYLQAQDWPSEEEQFAAYRAVAEAMDGKKVVIRTLDAGADKQLRYLDLTKERGIGVCLERPEMFRTQLRAILRASDYGTVSVMFPMITSAEELRACREQVELARSELLKRSGENGQRCPETVSGCSEGSCGSVEVGIMVETPEAVERSEELAREADFFCIGTNDLIPALLGYDRWDADGQGAQRDGERDPVVLDAIRRTIGNGHAAGIWVGICGEAAADTEMTETLVGMGIDELSVAPGEVLKVREKVREIE